MPLLALLTPRAFFWAAIFGLLLALGVEELRISHAEAALDRVQRHVAEVEAARERVAREAEARINKLQADNAAATQALSDAYAEDLKKREAALAAASADGDSLRAQVDRLTADRTVSATVDAAQCRRFADRAVTLGRLFGDADRLAERLAGEAERRNAEVRLLQQQLKADRAACEP